ncbi:MAG TPA: ABC transporter permease [Eubacteriaceae bacterium]|jgi:hypothetical protein|nr:ABC transporter permease [Eubacteriaceae bacterium]
MLKKLLKYELKATARLFIPLYAALLGFAIINRIINPFSIIESSASASMKTIFAYLSLTAYFAIIVGIIAMTLIIMIQRFYKSLLGDEGYLMFTLPVSTSFHITSKLVVSLVWTLTSFLSTVISIFIIINEPGLISELPEAFKAFHQILGTFGMVLFSLSALLAICAYILMIYAAISLGHQFQKNKLIASFGMYCVLYFINQGIIAISLFTFGNFYFEWLVSSNGADMLIGSSNPEIFELNLVLIFYMIFTALLTAAYFLLTNHILKKRLNLE